MSNIITKQELLILESDVKGSIIKLEAAKQSLDDLIKPLQVFLKSIEKLNNDKSNHTH